MPKLLDLLGINKKEQLFNNKIMPAGKLLSVLFGGDNPLKTVSDIVDTYVYTKEEKAADSIKATNQAQELELRREQLDQERIKYEIESFLKEKQLDIDNTKDARNREIEITNSVNASWLQKNIAPVIGLLVILYTFVLWTLILFRQYDPKPSESMIIGGLTTLSATVISYYFGSSASSKSKDETIKSLSNGDV